MVIRHVAGSPSGEFGFQSLDLRGIEVVEGFALVGCDKVGELAQGDDAGVFRGEFMPSTVRAAFAGILCTLRRPAQHAPDQTRSHLTSELVAKTAKHTTPAAETAPPFSVKNSSLSAAKTAKNDEFYTQWGDIEREMNAYLEYDKDVFRDKVVLLPCDDPEWSNFAKFFALHFTEYGIKKLISTSYAADSKPPSIGYQPTLFETDAPHFDETRTRCKGKMFVLERKDLNGDGVVDIEDLEWSYLEGDGDFRSDEVTALRDEADFVITNPPFSLFREFVTWLIGGAVKFSVVGSRNAATYNEIFALIKGSKLWIGKGFAKGDAYFGVPQSTKVDYATGVYDTETNLVHFRNTTWFTNIDHGRRHEPLQLMTMADNTKFSKHKEVRGIGYLKYDNFDAIDVPFVSAIPSDYDGLMGVPSTFLDKYNPDQFEIVFNSEDMEQNKLFGVEPLGEKRVADYFAAGGTGANSKGRRKLFLYGATPNVPFKRIIIRSRGA